jgi:hypothetical protein
VGETLCVHRVIVSYVIIVQVYYVDRYNMQVGYIKMLQSVIG